VDAGPRLVAAAAARIEAGFLNEGSVDALAAGLGVTGRHLRRALTGALGLSPVELAQSRRMALAKQLLQDTGLPVAEVAYASGFRSLRRFNALFRDRFGRPPTGLRREAGAGPRARDGALALRLDFRPPLDWEAMLAFLGSRAVAGVEEVAGGAYRRTVRLGARTGWIEVRLDPDRPALRAAASLSLAGALMPLASRLRSLFDLDARPDAVAAHLGRDPLLRRSVRRRPGLRVPGAFDGFETAARVVLGQQVSVRAASTLAGRLAAALGEPVETPFAALGRLSPTAGAVAEAGEDRLARLGMPGARARALGALAAAAADGRVALDPQGLRDGAGALRDLPGVGEWTAQVLAMRSGDPDAFPAGDLGVRRALGVAGGREAEARAERWRPWRAYAAMHLWTTLAQGAQR
jgi:AraC family transcriptional regulator of adaptative response / DNA-3-methyladenine glycosylase II